MSNISLNDDNADLHLGARKNNEKIDQCDEPHLIIKPSTIVEVKT